MRNEWGNDQLDCYAYRSTESGLFRLLDERMSGHTRRFAFLLVRDSGNADEQIVHEFSAFGIVPGLLPQNAAAFVIRQGTCRVFNWGMEENSEKGVL